jgi:hypothetical protein
VQAKTSDLRCSSADIHCNRIVLYNVFVSYMHELKGPTKRRLRNFYQFLSFYYFVVKYY